jgi:hypothetical protein
VFFINETNEFGSSLARKVNSVRSFWENFEHKIGRAEVVRGCIGKTE